MKKYVYMLYSIFLYAVVANADNVAVFVEQWHCEKLKYIRKINVINE
jgi:hypothetical protein